MTATTTVNMRTGPGVGYPVAGTFTPLDEVIDVLQGPIRADGMYWYQLRGGLWVAEATLDRVLIVDSGDLYGRSLAFVLSEEGGFQRNENDDGNWTGGKVGAGKLVGTKFGISAASFPELDIERLTHDQAAAIYRERYWLPSGAALQPWPLCVVVLDTAVLHGVAQAKSWLHAAKGNAITYLAMRLASYTAMDKWHYFGAGWVNRISRLMQVVAQ